MRYVAALIAGVAAFVIAIQGGIRLLLSSTDAGLLSWVPGGSIVQLIVYVLLGVGGAVLAGWARDRARATGHDV